MWTKKQAKALTRASKSAFQNLDADTQAKLHARFAAMDKNKDGSISKEEFMMTAGSDGDMSVSELRHVWEALDLNGDGQLDFWELGVLELMIRKSLGYSCDECKQMMIDGHMWNCHLCWADFLMGKIEHPGVDHLCTTCIPASTTAGGLRRCSRHPDQSLILVCNEPHKPVEEWDIAKQLYSKGHVRHQCSCCGESHAAVPKGYLNGSRPHMQQSGDGHWYCEWCTTWMCKRCSTSRVDMAKPVRGNWCGVWNCGGAGCAEKSPGQTWSYNDDQLKQLAAARDCANCWECKNKLDKKTMRASVGSTSAGGAVRGIQTLSGSFRKEMNNNHHFRHGVHTVAVEGFKAAAFEGFKAASAAGVRCAIM